MAVHVRPEARQAGDDLGLVGMLRLRLLLEGVLRDVDVDGTRPAGPGDVERLGEDPGQVVGVADEVVVLRHRQGDAVDVDLLEGVLAEEGGRDVAGDRDDGDGVEEGGADAGDEVRRPGTARPEADADPAGDPGVAVGGVGAALLVADEDVAQLGVVAEDVVEGQDDAAGIAEEHVDALAQERLADDVRPDAGPVGEPALVEHVLAGLLDGRRLRRAVVRHVGGATRWPRRVLRHRHRACASWSTGLSPGRVHKQKTLASRRGSLRSSVFGASSAPSSAFLRSPAGSR